MDDSVIIIYHNQKYSWQINFPYPESANTNPWTTAQCQSSNTLNISGNNPAYNPYENYEVASSNYPFCPQQNTSLKITIPSPTVN